MAEESDKGGDSSGPIDARADQLMRESRVVEAIALARGGRRAEIGLIAKSPKFFYDGKRRPLIPQFTPALIAKGSWKSDEPLLTADAYEKENAIANGKPYFAAAIVNLAEIADPAAFFRRFLETGGDVAIAPQFSPDLWRSVPYIGADSQTLNDPKRPLPFTGKGTAICVVDMGCDFAHRNFRQTDDSNATRLKLLAVMDANGKAEEYTDTAVKPNRNLNGLIGKAKPYREAGYDPNDPKYHVVPPDDGGAHGTLVLDIAGGNGGGTGMAGVAPEADLYFIQVYISTSASRRYVDGTQILNALAYARDKLTPLKVPAVYNVSLGTNQGPHDTFDYGATDLSWNIAINKLFDGCAGQCLVVSAGNNYNSALHATGTAAQNLPATFDVEVQAGDTTANPFAIWFKMPSGAVTVRAMLLDYYGAPKNYRGGWQTQETLFDGNQRASGSLGKIEPYGTKGDLYSIAVSIKPPLLRNLDGVQLSDNDRWEVWRIEVSSSASSSAPTVLDAWMDRDDLEQAVFMCPNMPPGQSANADVDPIGSLNGLAAGVKSAIVVGAVGAATFTRGMPVEGPGLGRAVAFSSAGPTRDKLLRPDVSAPGEGISGAKSGCDPVALKTGYEIAPTTIMSGTSMAAPHVTGLVALLFQKTAKKPLGVEEVRKALVATARPETTGSATRWDPQRGFGCVDAVKFLSWPWP